MSRRALADLAAWARENGVAPEENASMARG
jgi:hypothetical protein